MDIEKGLDKLIEIVQRETHCIVNNSPMELKHHTDRVTQKEIIIETFEAMRKCIEELEAYAISGMLVEMSCANCRHEEVDENLWEPCLSCRDYSEWELKR